MILEKTFRQFVTMKKINYLSIIFVFALHVNVFYGQGNADILIYSDKFITNSTANPGANGQYCEFLSIDSSGTNLTHDYKLYHWKRDYRVRQYIPSYSESYPKMTNRGNKIYMISSSIGNSYQQSSIYEMNLDDPAYKIHPIYYNGTYIFENKLFCKGNKLYTIVKDWAASKYYFADLSILNNQLTILGTAPWNYSGAYNLAIDTINNFIYGAKEDSIFKFNLNTNILVNLANSMSFTTIRSNLLLASNGNLFFANANSIISVNTTTGTINNSLPLNSIIGDWYCAHLIEKNGFVYVGFQRFSTVAGPSYHNKYFTLLKIDYSLGSTSVLYSKTITGYSGVGNDYDDFDGIPFCSRTLIFDSDNDSLLINTRDVTAKVNINDGNNRLLYFNLSEKGQPTQSINPITIGGLNINNKIWFYNWRKSTLGSLSGFYSYDKNSAKINPEMVLKEGVPNGDVYSDLIKVQNLYYGYSYNGGKSTTFSNGECNLDRGYFFNYDPITKTKTNLAGFNDVFGTYENNYYSYPTPPIATNLSNDKIYVARSKNIFEYSINSNNISLVYAGNYEIRQTLLAANNGNLYGLAYGNSNYCELFEFNTTNQQYTTLYNFNNSLQGINPTFICYDSVSNIIYGTANGGLNNVGTLFKYNLNTNSYNKILDYLDNLTNLNFAPLLIIGNNIYSNRGNSIIKYDILNQNLSTINTGFQQDDPIDGKAYYQNLIAGNNQNKLYGFALNTGNNKLLYSYDMLSQTISPLYIFNSTFEESPISLKSIGSISTNIASLANIKSESIEVFPNPNSGYISLFFNSKIPNTPIKIYDTQGRMVYENHEVRQIGKNTLNIQLEDIAPGVYYINAGARSQKFVVIK